MRSLRVRLVLATALVAALALAALALFSRRVVHDEYLRLVEKHPANGLAAVAHAFADPEAAPASRAETDALLERLAPATGHRLILVDSGTVVAASSPALRGARARFLPGERLELEAPGPGRGGAGGIGIRLMGPERLAITDREGRSLGTLVALPPDGPGPAAPFLRSVNRGLQLGVLVALAIGLGAVWLLSGRIVGPIEALTRAARSMELGDLTPRVEARGGDEVAALARSFNAMAESLARQADLRRRLSADVAHELRTPLTNLRAQIEAIEDGLIAPDARALRSLHRETMLLARLVDDLQDLARAEAGALPLDRSRLPVRAALEAAVASAGARAAEKGVELRVEPGEAPDLDADAQRLAQILGNLVANALTHTEAGGVVTLGARARGETVEIAVTDTGEGISAEHLPHIFDRFYRADASRSRATGGVGLGLAIVRTLAEAHGGAARAESASARGTTVFVTIPAAR